jgi:hypothetical protein
MNSMKIQNLWQNGHFLIEIGMSEKMCHNKGFLFMVGYMIWVIISVVEPSNGDSN